MSQTTLEDLLIEELNDLYDAEKKITKGLPKMIKAAASEELAAALEDHLQETEEQISRLEQAFETLGVKPGRKKCEAMEGLLLEAKDVLDSDFEGAVKDAAIISAAQKVEHYEIAGYGCVRTWAKLLEHEDVAELLQQSLDEEGAADEKLNEIAENLNLEAEEESEEEEPEGDGMSKTRRGSRRRTAAAR